MHDLSAKNSVSLKSLTSKWYCRLESRHTPQCPAKVCRMMEPPKGNHWNIKKNKTCSAVMINPLSWGSVIKVDCNTRMRASVICQDFPDTKQVLIDERYNLFNPMREICPNNYIYHKNGCIYLAQILDNTRQLPHLNDICKLHNGSLASTYNDIQGALYSDFNFEESERKLYELWWCHTLHFRLYYLVSRKNSSVYSIFCLGSYNSSNKCSISELTYISMGIDMVFHQNSLLSNSLGCTPNSSYDYMLTASTQFHINSKPKNDFYCYCSSPKLVLNGLTCLLNATAYSNDNSTCVSVTQMQGMADIMQYIPKQLCYYDRSLPLWNMCNGIVDCPSQFDEDHCQGLDLAGYLFMLKKTEYSVPFHSAADTYVIQNKDGKQTYCVHVRGTCFEEYCIPWNQFCILGYESVSFSQCPG